MERTTEELLAATDQATRDEITRRAGGDSVMVDALAWYGIECEQDWDGISNTEILAEYREQCMIALEDLVIVLRQEDGD